MTPTELAKPGTEHAHQRAVFAWANCAARYGFEYADNDLSYDHRTVGGVVGLWSYTVPELSRLFAIHNQGHGDKIRGNRAKAEGVKSGVPDMMLPVPRGGYHGLFIELKKGKRASTSETQDDWIRFLADAGYCAVVAFGWQEAAEALRSYIKGISQDPAPISGLADDIVGRLQNR